LTSPSGLKYITNVVKKGDSSVGAGIRRVTEKGNSVSESSSQKNRHFYPPGEPIRPHLLCCEGFAVPGVQLHPPRLASAAASTREYARLIKGGENETNF
jgi:hypothetical protein